LFGCSLHGREAAGNFRHLAFRVGGQLLPNRPFLSLSRQPLLDALAGAGVFLGFPFRTAGGIFALGNAATKALYLLPQRGRGIDGLRRRDEGPRPEIGLLSVGAVKPDAKLAREFQRVARLLGFILVRQKGSHARWNHPDGRAMTFQCTAARKLGHPYSTEFSGNWASRWMNFRSFARSKLASRFC
jgi:predicted RNA binding protein YcfA (HicA-like mRNA interferase family)